MSDRTPDSEALVRHAEFLRAVARRLLRREDGVDDLVQETYVAALTSGAAASGDGSRGSRRTSLG